MKKILLAYATHSGTTSEVTQRIAGVFQKMDARVDIDLVGKVKSIDGYQAVVVGTPVWMFEWLPEAVRFVDRFKEKLSALPVAYFMVGLEMRKNTPRARNKAMAWLQPILRMAPFVRPVDVGLFAGVYDPKKVPLIERIVMRLAGEPVGDFRRWEVIEHWAERVFPLLQTNLGERPNFLLPAMNETVPYRASSRGWRQF